jgi:hypothetical protein
MKSISTYIVGALALLAISTPAMSQTVADSVSMGPQYHNQVFYSISNGIAGTTPLASWDIAFELTGFSSSILTNGGANIQLYSVPDKTVDNWSESLDTSGMATSWNSHYNSLETWSSGAFTMGRDYESGDFGWGEYNMVTHTVNGTSLYVVKLSDGTARKIMVESLAGRRYTFRHANLDGSDEVTKTLSKDDYPGKHFIYYSLRDRKAMDVEPPVDSWDLLFGKYIAMLGPNADMPYGVIGVLANEGVQIAEVQSSNPMTEPTPSDPAFIDSIAAIGYDWKTFTGSAYQVSDMTAYFVRTRQGEIYRLRFTGFDGSFTGTSRFEKTLMAAASVRYDNNARAAFALYPNVVAPGQPFTLVHGLDRAASNASFAVYTMQGTCIYTQPISVESGLRQQELHLDLPSGVYLTAITVNNVRAQQPLIVR